MTDLIDCVVGLAEVIEAHRAVIALDGLSSLLEKKSNKAGSYYYEDVTVKQWALGSGGVSGNCEECVENSESGWIEESEPFPAYSQYGPVDEPPLHDHCDCTIEYRDTRRRVYV